MSEKLQRNVLLIVVVILVIGGIQWMRLSQSTSTKDGDNGSLLSSLAALFGQQSDNSDNTSTNNCLSIHGGFGDIVCSNNKIPSASGNWCVCPDGRMGEYCELWPQCYHKGIYDKDTDTCSCVGLYSKFNNDMCQCVGRQCCSYNGNLTIKVIHWLTRAIVT